MTTQHVTPGSIENKEQYHWTFTGRLVAVDNGSRFSSKESFKQVMELDSFSFISFDPLNKLTQLTDLDTINELQVIPNTTLGNGHPVTRYDCLNEATSATLKPLAKTLANTYATADKNSGPNRIIIEPAIASIALDDIDGLPHVDWLLLDEFNDNASILKNSGKTLSSSLLIDVRIPFQATHEGQAEFSVIHHFLTDYGFRFLRFQNTQYKTDLPTDLYLEQKQFSDTLIANALFIPTDDRLENMSENDLLKLGFLLHSIYKSKDTAYRMLNYVDSKLAKEYLVAEGFLWPVDENENEFTLTASYSPDIWVNK